MECAASCLKGLVVQPGRIFKILEETAQRLRRAAQHLVLLLYAGPDEPVQLTGRQGGELLHYRIQRGIADCGVPDIVVGRCLVVEAGLLIALGVCRRR